MLGQALANLLTNAVKFRTTGSLGDVLVRGERRGDRTRLWVEDDGIGIAPEDFNRIFVAFERLHGQEAFPGTGIGLAIVKVAVERMGGVCGVDSSEGQGARFYIDPASKPSELGTAPSSGQQNGRAIDDIAC